MCPSTQVFTYIHHKPRVIYSLFPVYNSKQIYCKLYESDCRNTIERQSKILQRIHVKQMS